METLNFKKWLEDANMANNNARPPEETNPALGPAAKAAQIAAQNAIKKGKNPIKAAQENLVKNKTIPMNKLGDIMPIINTSNQ